MSKIYPFRWYEKVCASCLLGITLVGFTPITSNKLPISTPVEDSKICISVGFIVNIAYCWEKSKPKKEIAPIPPSDSPGNCGTPGICKPECPCE